MTYVQFMGQTACLIGVLTDQVINKHLKDYLEPLISFQLN